MNLKEKLEQLRLSHRTCEDPWYSCPKSGDCCNDNAADECDCGADEHNKILDEILAANP